MKSLSMTMQKFTGCSKDINPSLCIIYQLSKDLEEEEEEKLIYNAEINEGLN